MRAEEGHADRLGGDRSARSGRHRRDRRGAARSRRRPEDEAAARHCRQRSPATALRVDRAFTGRANLFASSAGRVRGRQAARSTGSTASIQPSRVATLAGLSAGGRQGEMVATVKIIPFAVAAGRARRGRRRRRRAPLIAGRALPPCEGRCRLDAAAGPQAQRHRQDAASHRRAACARSGAAIVAERRVPHEHDGAVAEASREVLRAGDELVMVFGASAMVDRARRRSGGDRSRRRDVSRTSACRSIPAISCCSATLGGKPVLGAPGCARSPKENGFDWVLDRLLAGLT